MLDKLYVRSLFNYDPKTGELRWTISKGTAYRGMVVTAKNTDGYVHVKIDRRIYLVHRIAFTWMGEELPPQVDHKNRIRDDNRWDNLRPATNSVNQRNRGGVAGVYPNGRGWRAAFAGKFGPTRKTLEEAKDDRAKLEAA